MLQDVHQFCTIIWVYSSETSEMLDPCYPPVLWRSSPGRHYIRRDFSRVERGASLYHVWWPCLVLRASHAQVAPVLVDILIGVRTFRHVRTSISFWHMPYHAAMPKSLECPDIMCADSGTAGRSAATAVLLEGAVGRCSMAFAIRGGCWCERLLLAPLRLSRGQVT